MVQGFLVEEEEDEVMKDGIRDYMSLGSLFIIKATDGQMKACSRYATHLSTEGLIYYQPPSFMWTRWIYSMPPLTEAIQLGNNQLTLIHDQ